MIPLLYALAFYALLIGEPIYSTHSAPLARPSHQPQQCMCAYAREDWD